MFKSSTTKRWGFYQTQTVELAFAALIIDLILGPSGEVLGEAIDILDDVASDFAGTVPGWGLHEVGIFLFIIAVSLTLF